MSTQHLQAFIKDMKQELRIREDSEQLLETDLRRHNAQIGVSLTQITKETALSKHAVYKAYTTNQPNQQLISYVQEQKTVVLEQAKQHIHYLQRLAQEHLTYDEVLEVETITNDQGFAWGLSIPDQHNYIAGFGACGISKNTYPLPEAQIDRFLLKIIVPYPTEAEELEIVNRFTTAAEITPVNKLLGENSIKLLQKLTRQVPIADDIKQRAVKLVQKTRNTPELIEYGASPRASIGLILAAKAHALIQGRKFVSSKDIDAMALPVLRHRIIPSFSAEREGKTTDDIVNELLKKL